MKTTYRTNAIEIKIYQSQWKKYTFGCWLYGFCYWRLSDYDSPKYQMADENLWWFAEYDIFWMWQYAFHYYGII